MNLKKVILLSKRDRIGLGIFLACGIAVQAFLYLGSLRKFRNAESILVQNLCIISPDTLPDRKKSKMYSGKMTENERHSLIKTKSKIPVPASAIDPNTADSMSLIKLGFKAYTVRNLLAYRRTGAVFKDIHGLSRIYGMDSILLYSLEDNFIFPVQKFSETYTVNINEADSLELQKLVGIGPVLSARTVRYRNALGGFIVADQLLEVFGIDPDILKRNASHIICSGPVRQLDLNTASEDILKRHPYIDYETASLIIKYREQHGAFKSVKALKSIHLMKDSTFEKIQPYCMVKHNN